MRRGRRVKYGGSVVGGWWLAKPLLYASTSLGGRDESTREVCDGSGGGLCVCARVWFACGRMQIGGKRPRCPNALAIPRITLVMPCRRRYIVVMVVDVIFCFVVIRECIITSLGSGKALGPRSFVVCSGMGHIGLG